MTARAMHAAAALSILLVSCSAPDSTTPQVVTRRELRADGGHAPARVFYNPAQIVPVDAGAADAGPDCSPVLTPGGAVPRACAHEVPNGGSVEAADAGIFVIKDAAGRAVAQFPEVCPCYRDAGSNTGSDAGK